MVNLDYLESDLHSCKLCEWRCGVDRLSSDTGKWITNAYIGDKLDHDSGSNSRKYQVEDLISTSNINSDLGVCGCTLPLVATSMLHPAPPASFDAFMTGCNFRCLFCQNWSISMQENIIGQRSFDIEGYYEPAHWGELAVAFLNTEEAKMMRADRLFFTGGEPTCALPWVEDVVDSTRKDKPKTKVNFDTNGFFTKDSLKRVLEFTNSITYDLKAFDPDLFKMLTGANVKPVLRNLKHIIKNAQEQLWEVRVMVIPGIHEKDIVGICKFIADIDPTIKLNFLGFRPNFVMENYLGATFELCKRCISVANDFNLENATWSGQLGIGGAYHAKFNTFTKESDIPQNIAILSKFAHDAGCISEIRNCGTCQVMHDCTLKHYHSSTNR
jgi:pyruvate formate lyase activating enzyme